MTGSDAAGLAEIETSCVAGLVWQPPASLVVDVVDDGKVGRLGVVGDLDPHGRQRRIVGEADVTFGLPGQ